MQTPVNTFKQALAAGTPQIGLWAALASAYSTELLAGIGYDWLLIDGEHAPNDVRNTLAQLQAVASAQQAFGDARSHPIVRVPVGTGDVGVALIKQHLDIGAQTLLVPMIDTAEQADLVVKATRYAPAGIRGMGSALARASRWQAHARYVHEANDQICVLVQAETVEAMKNLDAIAATPGVDGEFIGP
ncbi:MAG: aldolase/citrate lyase family protein, partial [Hydrogenophaga sp.]|nr:aldolase/citrate lyase family protein [Hydrogenophaga sp.]